MNETRPDLPPVLTGLLSRPPHVAVYGLLAGSLLLNLALIVGGGDGVEAEPPAPLAAEEAEPALLAEAGAKFDEAVEAVGEAPEAAPVAVVAEAVKPPAGAWQTTTAEVSHSIARTFQLALGDHGPAVAAEFARPFVWDFDMRRDLLKGDFVATVWRTLGEGEATEYEIAAARLRSGKKGDMRVYAFTAPGDKWPSFWRPDGTEMASRFVDGPMDSYEQITALLKDRPDHGGIDFKAPVGSTVKSPRNGRVTRVNWNWRFNGNSIEVRFEDGVVAKFLHLSENRVKAGDRVTAGQVIALSGNTGRSTAPHLHYQLERGSKIVDPVEYHQMTRRSLPASAMEAFRAVVAQYDALLEREDG